MRYKSVAAAPPLDQVDGSHPPRVLHWTGNGLVGPICKETLQLRKT